ncbi:hypothetical protein F5884DRAFT_747475 [Xylogone sp. PMI_703]|nr:hypothetical protein F5884DRAFT_747475 [Xylogone sp. PMI_703]
MNNRLGGAGAGQDGSSGNGGGGIGAGDGVEHLGSFYAYRDTFDENSVWVDVPKTVTFYNISDPFNMETSPDPDDRPQEEPQDLATSIEAPQAHDRQQEDTTYFPVTFDEAPGLEALSEVATSSSNFQYRPLSVSVQSSGAESNLSPPPPPPANTLDFLLNPSSRTDLFGSNTPIDPILRSSSKTPAWRRQRESITDHEVSFLMRHFSEVAGQWMDLFDLGCYFAHQVPVTAISNSLMRYSACAYAAKQLGRVQGRKAIVGGIVSKQAAMEVYPSAETVDWAYIGAKYYDKAINLLMEEVSQTTMRQDMLDSESGVQSPSGIPDQQHQNKRRRLSRPSSTSNPDETLAAVAILSVYEFLDNTNTAWGRHLSGTKSLFDMANNEYTISGRPIHSLSYPHRMKPSRARKATFWNFARQDVLAAFINETLTRLNPYELDLWRAAGLLIDEQGFVVPSNREESEYPEGQPAMREDMISNALIWLIAKIVNYMASGDSIDHVFPQDRSSPLGVVGINQMTLLERWRELENELQVWYDGLPDTFKPVARLPPITDGSIPSDSPRAIFPEIWYSIPMCASTMQSYHMARSLLLINKPHESTVRRSTVSDRLNSYRTIEAEARHHSHEICGIALGRPEASVRINQVQALFVAGQILNDSRERQIVLDLLRGIEEDLGWATDYRVRQLLKEWEWNAEPS